EARANADVVDAHENDDPGDAALIEDVALETIERRRSDESALQAVTADTGVDYGDLCGRGVGLQPLGEAIGPAAVGVERRAGAVGDRVADRDDRRRLGREHIDGA